ncbi:MAG TPA: hypothetical protein VMM55_05665 [Thermohalobaculum sp.]|nr:hypothetical protein [Thermohalobaculum sp.]
MRNVLTFASALALAAGVGAPPVLAQSEAETQSQDQMQSGSGSEAMQSQATGDGQEQSDGLVATVGDTEIRQSDVLVAIEGLPQGVQQTPPQMLLPAVVDQLIMRRLIVEEARAEGLESDSEVQELAEADSDSAMEQALVEVWLKRELEERVTEPDVDKAVEELQATNPDVGDAPTIVPQVRQALQVQAMTDISDELRQDAEITFYGPDGQPVDETRQVGSGAEGEGDPETQPQD